MNEKSVWLIICLSLSFAIPFLRYTTTSTFSSSSSSFDIDSITTQFVPHPKNIRANYNKRVRSSFAAAPQKRATTAFRTMSRPVAVIRHRSGTIILNMTLRLDQDAILYNEIYRNVSNTRRFLYTKLNQHFVSNKHTRWIQNTRKKMFGTVRLYSLIKAIQSLKRFYYT